MEIISLKIVIIKFHSLFENNPFDNYVNVDYYYLQYINIKNHCSFVIYSF